MYCNTFCGFGTKKSIEVEEKKKFEKKKSKNFRIFYIFLSKHFLFELVFF